MLSRMDKPLILDIGCGSGISTLELARRSQGEINRKKRNLGYDYLPRIETPYGS